MASLNRQSSLTTLGMVDRMDALQRDRQYTALDDSRAAPINEENTTDETLKTVDELTDDINQIEQYTEKLARNHTAILSSFQNEQAPKQNEEIQDNVRQLSHHVTDELKRMKEMLDKEGTGPDRNTADYRIRKAQHSTLSRKFHDVMMEYNKELEDYREKNKEKIHRQLKIAGQDVSDERLERMLEEENPQAFTQSILGDTAQKRRMLSEVETRHTEILKLEENIRELHDMFYDLAQLINDQGDLINQIEFNVDHAAVYIERGTQAVRVAADYKRKNRKITCCICCVVSCIAITLLLAIIIAIAIGVYAVRDRL